MAKISASVGKGGKNKPEDVKTVQQLLNDFTKMCGFKKLDEDGLIGSKTLTAIAEFQKTAVGMAKPDSRIDTNGDSIKTLTSGPKKAESEIKKAEEAEKEKKEKEEAKKAAKEEKEGAKKESNPQVKGDTKGVDKKILEVLKAVSAHFGKPIHVEPAPKSFASSSTDGASLWQDWEGKLNRGEGLRGELRKQLNKLYNKKDNDGFCKLVDKSSGELKGGGSSSETVNIKKISSDMVDALKTILSCEKDGDNFCLDATGKNIPSKITDDMKKKWG